MQPRRDYTCNRNSYSQTHGFHEVIMQVTIYEFIPVTLLSIVSLTQNKTLKNFHVITRFSYTDRKESHLPASLSSISMPCSDGHQIQCIMQSVHVISLDLMSTLSVRCYVQKQASTSWNDNANVKKKAQRPLKVEIYWSQTFNQESDRLEAMYVESSSSDLAIRPSQDAPKASSKKLSSFWDIDAGSDCASSDSTCMFHCIREEGHI